MGHSTLALIDTKAKIGKDVSIGHYSIVSKDVVIEDGCTIANNVTILDGVRIGKNSRVFPGAILGAIPQDLKYEGEESVLEIGENVTIREYCTVNRGTIANFKTYIGNNSLLMAYVHVAHDCVLGKNVILSNNVNLAGHIEVGDYAILGGLTAVHQFVKIGQHSFIGGGSLVRKDIPPFVKAAREPLSYAGINAVGLRRRNFTPETINTIQDIYRLLFVRGYNTSQAIKKIQDTIPECPEKAQILNFIHDAKRGIMKSFKQINGGR
ncbi:MAG: acyl-ACP--UDP-N-acetylglucosamine O-acyltransferase [Bacteroidia bacterium]|nr:acyl-ACP--UDP-N-acetylglucosamine O-acyltransferase [Bacteroidia bacterium]